MYRALIQSSSIVKINNDINRSKFKLNESQFTYAYDLKNIVKKNLKSKIKQ